MKKRLLRSPAFIRAAKRAFRKDLQRVDILKSVLAQLSEDPFHPSLRSHKLKGKLEGSWACSVGYDLRILFSFVDHEGQEAILLETLGSHDEVY